MWCNDKVRRGKRRHAGWTCAACLVLLGCESRQEQGASTKPVSPCRIISISPNSTEIIGVLGAADRLVAVSDYCLWPAEVNKLPKVGGLFDANLELMLRLSPDLIVLRGAQRGVEQLCVSSGIALYRDRTERLDDIFATLHELGELLGCGPQALEAELQMRETLSNIRAAIEGRPRPRVLMTLARDTQSIGSVMTGAKDTFIDDLISAAGGENIFRELASAYPSISQEAILVAQPEVIIEVFPEREDTAELRGKLLSQWKQFGTLPAVDRQRVYFLFDENVLIPSPRIVETIRRVAKLLHPEAAVD